MAKGSKEKRSDELLLNPFNDSDRFGSVKKEEVDQDRIRDLIRDTPAKKFTCDCRK